MLEQAEYALEILLRTLEDGNAQLGPSVDVLGAQGSKNKERDLSSSPVRERLTDGELG